MGVNIPATAFGDATNGTGLVSPSPEPSVSAINVYEAATSTSIRPDLAAYPERVYVPDSLAATVDVIDPKTFTVIAHMKTGSNPYHITPAWDMRGLYIDNELPGTLQLLDPAKGTAIGTFQVPHPYNLYFTLDGSRAIVVDERDRRLYFRDPHTWAPLGQVDIPWPGVDHMDFSADGAYLLASCEFSGTVVKVDVNAMAVSGMVNVGGRPIDVRLSPDGSVFYVANQDRGGVSIIDPATMKEIAFLPTGSGAHGLEVSRDARSLYVSNRSGGSISVIDFATRKVVGTWQVGGSPDMMQLSPDGGQLWVSLRYDKTVLVVDTKSGQVSHRIPVGLSPHGLSYFPNPGRFSLGHNGIYR